MLFRSDLDGRAGMMVEAWRRKGGSCHIHTCQCYVSSSTSADSSECFYQHPSSAPLPSLKLTLGSLQCLNTLPFHKACVCGTVFVCVNVGLCVSVCVLPLSVQMHVCVQSEVGVRGTACEPLAHRNPPFCQQAEKAPNQTNK